MLGKLMKYEYRATARTMLPLYGGVVLAAVLARISLLLMDRDLPFPFSLLTGLVMVVFGIGLAAVAILCVTVMVRRFKTGVLGEEGYLTMTLPASVHEIVWSRILVSMTWFLAAGAVIALSFGIVIFDLDLLRRLVNPKMLEEFFSIWDASAALALVEWVALIFLGGVTVCLSFYAAMSIGYGFSKDKTLLSAVAFIVLGMLMSWLSGTVSFRVFLENAAAGGWESFLPEANRFLFLEILVSMAQGTIYYFITIWNLKHRLNLE